jgi:hypothetical protein
MKSFVRLASLCVLALLPSLAFAQGTTGSLNGTVTTDGKALPGATITIASPSMQGTKTAVSGESGGYYFPGLPPGEYTVTFDLSGMQTVTKKVSINVAQTSRADAALRVAAVAEAMTVTASSSPTVETPTVTTNFKVDQINELPMNRTIDAVTLLSPGVTEAGPNNQIVISGANSFDSLFLVDGVIVNENLRGQPNPLYIEDAIQETTVQTGGISAEYGRFTGGVVSTITKSGGNEFTGTLRDNLTNPNWSEKTDFAGQVDPLDDINHQYEATFGGRIVRDRLWFFTAGRKVKKDETRQTTFTNIPYPYSDRDRRYEAKLTAQLTQNHSITGAYTDEHDRADNTVAGRTSRVMDLRGLAPYDQPRSLLSVNYSGVLTQNFLLEGQFSRMRDRFTQGAENRDLIQGTLLLDTTSGNRAWSSTFCGSPCPAKQRNNKEWLAKGSYFLSNKGSGNHSLVGGYDEFHQIRNENNFQSGSDYRIHGVILCDKGGIAVVCASVPSSQLTSSNIYFGTDVSSGQIEYDPVPALSHTSDFAVRSLFINDKWDLNSNWSFNLGARYDKAFGSDQAGHKTVDDSAMSPRLALNFDPKGNGKHRFSATYGRYVSKVDQGPADQTATAGRYASYYWDYAGPELNKAGTPIANLLPTDQVIKRVFDWFNSVGGSKNTTFLTDAFVPGTTNRFEHSLSAPHMDEYTLGYGLSVGSKGYVRADYIHRKWADFYTVRRTIATGKAVDPNGTTFDQGVIENSSSSLSRRYQAVQMQASYRISKPLSLGGNYTYSKLRGNVEGESASGATGFTSPMSYPEYISFAQNNPDGFLGPDMRNRLNAWAQYDWQIPFGVLNFSLLEHYHSGLGYSAVGTIDVRQGAANGPAIGVVNPGYATAPTNVAYYFTDRGAFRLDPIYATDLGVNLYVGAFHGVRPFVETEILNVFNKQGIEDPDFIDQTVLTRRQATCIQSGSTARCTAFNPFTTTPAQGVNWQYGANFGKPTSQSAYQLPRTYRFSVGLKF